MLSRDWLWIILVDCCNACEVKSKYKKTYNTKLNKNIKIKHIELIKIFK